MFVIADGISKDTGAYPAKIATLMRQCNRSESTVHRHITRCIALGELVVLDGTHSPNTFYIPILPDEAGFAPQECDGVEHSCNKLHTPLYVNREDLADSAIKAARSRRRNPHKGTNIGTPHQNESNGAPVLTPPPVSTDTPGYQERHPGVSVVAPNTHIDTPFITPVIPQGVAPSLTKLEEVDHDAEADPPLLRGAPPVECERLTRQQWQTQFCADYQAKYGFEPKASVVALQYDLYRRGEPVR